MQTQRQGDAQTTPAPAARSWLVWSLAIALMIAILSLAALACDDGAEPDESAPDEDGATTVDVEEALRRMVLQLEDLPAGLQRVDQTSTTNEELIKASPDPDAKRAEVEQWRRILGHETIFQPGPDAAPDIGLVAVVSSSSLYETADGAAQSFTDARKTVEETDWQASRPDFQEFQAELIEREGLADELVWLRLSSISETQGVIVEDFIIFRVEGARGFLRAVATAPGDDRGLLLDDVEAWLATQIQRTKETLAAGIEEVQASSSALAPEPAAM